ncbi:MAG: LysE family translocator [Syntrophothermus sp.]
MIQYLILGITFAFAAAVQPGPFQSYLISQSLSKGWRRTFVSAFAPLFSDGPIIILTLFILTRMPHWLISVLQLSGGAFLFYLAFESFKTWKKYDPNNQLTPEPDNRPLWKAVMVNLLNPNPYLGWSLVMGPLLLKGWRENPAYAVSLLTGFYTTIILGSFTIVLIFSAARTLGPRLNRTLLGLSVITIAGFGCFELFMGVKDLFLN